MIWVYLLLLSVILWGVGRVLRSVDDVYSIAAIASGLISLIWGFLWAPSVVQLMLAGALLVVNRYDALQLRSSLLRVCAPKPLKTRRELPAECRTLPVAYSDQFTPTYRFKRLR